MGNPNLNYYTENPLDFEKNPKVSNLKSLWAFLLSIFIYISVFYVFKLSPSALLCTTKFWFIMSNTLILIISADFGAFSSSKEHNEYCKNNIIAAKSTVSSFDIQYVRIDQKKLPRVDEEPREKIIDTIESSLENKPGIFPTGEKDDDPPASEKNKREENGGREAKRRKLKTAMPAENQGKMFPTLSKRYEEPRRLEENEYSKMSDEEVNRRVEEFIRRFNRQIRVQATRNRT